MRHLLSLCFAALLIFPSTAFAQLQISSTTTTETFGNFLGTGLIPVPLAGELDSDNWKVLGFSNGDTTFGGTFTAGDHARGASIGGVSTGGLYAFTVAAGVVGIGVQPGGSDFTPGSAVLRIENNTAAPIASLTVTYDGWFNNNGDRSNSVIFGHSDDDITYVDEAGTLLVTPEALDANGWSGGVPTAVVITPASPIAIGAFYYLRWSSDDVAGSGARDEIALTRVEIRIPVVVVCVSDADCDDGVFCNGDETCDPADANADAMGCVPSAAARNTDDGFSCTTDSCDEANDVIVNTPDNAACDDTLFCNGVEACTPADANADPATGCVAGMAVVVDDAVGCTVDTCDEANDVVVNTADDALCDDVDVCTDDVCDAVNDCQFTANGCSINATCFADAALNPNNPCEVCDISADTTDWTLVAENTLCGMAMCSLAELTPAPLCDNAGACVAGALMVCANGCMNGMCNAPCGVDADCAIGWCDLGAGGVCSIANRTPTAAITAIDIDIEVDATGGTFSVDGTGSSDPDGDVLTYIWTIVSGGALTFGDATSEPLVTIPAGVTGDVEIALTVNDGTEDSVQVIETVTIVSIAGMDADADMGNANNQNNVNNANNQNPDAGGDASSPAKTTDEGCCATTGGSRSSDLFLLLGLLFVGARIRRRKVAS